MAVDTACSSSLTAIHLACAGAAQRASARVAIAGGVNLTLHPGKYLDPEQGQASPSSDGRCRSFGAGGDGYVPGEGVGAVLLKPLARALADGDHIYAVIRGSAVNHGGRTNGYTVPNPEAQGSLDRRPRWRRGASPRDASATSRRTAPAPRWATRSRSRASPRAFDDGVAAQSRARRLGQVEHRPPRIGRRHRRA